MTEISVRLAAPVVDLEEEANNLLEVGGSKPLSALFHAASPNNGAMISHSVPPSTMQAVPGGNAALAASGRSRRISKDDGEVAVGVRQYFDKVAVAEDAPGHQLHALIGQAVVDYSHVCARGGIGHWCG